MSRIKSRDTKPEIAVRATVRALGHAYRVDVAGLPGKPDLANRSKGWAILVHGCFWHGHGCKRSGDPKSNRDYWTPKLHRNRDRDSRNAAALSAMGMRVLTVWECETKDAAALRAALEAFLTPPPEAQPSATS